MGADHRNMRNRPFPNRPPRPRATQPAGFNLAAAFTTSLLLVAGAHVVELPTYWAVALIAIGVGLCSTGATWRASLGVAVIGWLFVTGFVINRLGELHVTGLPDAWRLLLMVGVAVVSTAASRHGVRTGRRLDVLRPAEPSTATVVAQPAGFEPVAGDRTVPTLITGIHA